MLRRPRSRPRRLAAPRSSSAKRAPRCATKTTPAIILFRFCVDKQSFFHQVAISFHIQVRP